MSCGVFLASWFSLGFLGGVLALLGAWIGHKRADRPYTWDHLQRTLLWMTVFGYAACFVGAIIFLIALFSSRARYEREINRQIEDVLQQAANAKLRLRNLRRVSRIEVNASLHKLMYEEMDPEGPMRSVIAFAHGLRITRERAVAERNENLKEDKIIMGHTPELGDVSISHRDGEEYEDSDLQLGRKARVGQFRVWKCRSNLIAFHHFWAADESTRHHNEERARALYIQFNSETLEPECFAGTKEEPWFRFLGRTVYKVTLDALWGKADPNIGLVDCRIR
ncbi:MAG TPA: hypothetical protein VJ579_00795 [Candidatus Paceibacterota bacterium]|nr:hypothetical protein [Candidatus Paceibacterota bacterium]